MINDKCLGLIDWGIGGISVYKEIKTQLGDIPIVYFSDTGAIPYGKMSRPELVKRLDAVIEFLYLQRVTHLVIGCNAASTAIPFLNHEKVMIEGVIESAVNFVKRQNPQRLALIGGKRTVLSGIYRRKFAEIGIKTEQRIAQPLSALIESGDTTSEKLRQEVKKIISPIKNSSHILLACTHYPAITNVIKDFVSPQTVLIDPAGELVKVVKKWNLATDGKDVFYTTGDAKSMQNSAENAFNVKIEKIENVTI